MISTSTQYLGCGYFCTYLLSIAIPLTILLPGDYILYRVSISYRKMNLETLETYVPLFKTGKYWTLPGLSLCFFFLLSSISPEFYFYFSASSFFYALIWHLFILFLGLCVNCSSFFFSPQLDNVGNYQHSAIYIHIFLPHTVPLPPPATFRVFCGPLAQLPRQSVPTNCLWRRSVHCNECAPKVVLFLFSTPLVFANSTKRS